MDVAGILTLFGLNEKEREVEEREVEENACKYRFNIYGFGKCREVIKIYRSGSASENIVLDFVIGDFTDILLTGNLIPVFRVENGKTICKRKLWIGLKRNGGAWHEETW
ncbi:unnamed protein product [Vicia faba]|uniref:Uncharacterized protein n=1 Tax=Vicia faba TaxID=3906 RepID=A0AAV0ZPT1_VICFA|nr:unnamed protein product [Vicia faba]